MLSINCFCASGNLQNTLIFNACGAPLHSGKNYFSTSYFFEASETTRDSYTQYYPSSPKRRALLIGIQNYDENPLDGPLNDVQGLHDVLTRQYHFHPSDIISITDTGSRQPTRANILSAIRNLVYNARRTIAFLFTMLDTELDIQDLFTPDRLQCRKTLWRRSAL